MIKKIGFTLAEALLALSVVGVVAAMTIPTIKDYSEEAKFVALLKKAYSTMQTSTAAAESKYGEVGLWNWSANAKARYLEVLNGHKYTGSSYSVKKLDGTAWGTVGDWIQTPDGMLIEPSTYEGNVLLYVDTNGPGKPNVVGVDVHAFVVNNDGIFPLGSKYYGAGFVWACTNYIIKKGKMPWMHDASITDCGTLGDPTH